MELLPGTLTPWLQASLVRLGSWMPFGHAARELGWLTRVAVSRQTAQRLTEAAGAAYVAEQTARVEELERRPTPEPTGPAVLQVSADGAMVSLVHRQWTEVKTVAIGTVVREAGGEVRAREPSYFSRRTDHASFRRLALAETHRRGVGTAGAVVAVMDGAEWLQGFVDFHRRDAVRVLDFPHAVEYLTRAGHEALGVGMAATPAANAWLSEQAHALKHDGPEPVLAALRALPVGEHRDAALAYLEPRLAQVQYPTFRAAGYPIGSGLVEGANKVVVEDRLQGQRHALGARQRRPDARAAHRRLRRPLGRGLAPARRTPPHCRPHPTRTAPPRRRRTPQRPRGRTSCRDCAPGSGRHHAPISRSPDPAAAAQDHRRRASHRRPSLEAPLPAPSPGSACRKLSRTPVKRRTSNV